MKNEARKTFRELLTFLFNDDWKLFKESTGGILYQFEDDGQLTMCLIETPQDLIKYYNNIYDSFEVNDLQIRIVLSEKSTLQVMCERCPNGFDDWDLSTAKLVAEENEFFRSTYETMKLYSDSFKVEDPLTKIL